MLTIADGEVRHDLREAPNRPSGFQSKGLVDEHVLNECRLQCGRIGLRSIDHYTGAVFVVRAEVAVDEMCQYQRHNCTARQKAVDLQAAVVNQSLCGVGVYREHGRVLSGLADFHRHGEHRAGNGVLRGWHGAHCRTCSNSQTSDGQISVASSRICSAFRPVTTIMVTPAASHTLICSRT